MSPELLWRLVGITISQWHQLKLYLIDIYRAKEKTITIDTLLAT